MVFDVKKGSIYYKIEYGNVNLYKVINFSTCLNFMYLLGIENGKRRKVKLNTNYYTYVDLNNLNIKLFNKIYTSNKTKKALN